MVIIGAMVALVRASGDQAAFLVGGVGFEVNR
jgi:hypothetical protein